MKLLNFLFQLPAPDDNPNRPVMVFFHSGGWFYNSGTSVVHGPQYLMDKDIVLVTTNYRLGALGERDSLDIKNHINILRKAITCINGELFD